MRDGDGGDEVADGVVGGTGGKGDLLGGVGWWQRKRRVESSKHGRNL